MNKRCLYCYQGLSEEQIDFHPRCSRAFFGSVSPPKISFTWEQMQQLATTLVLRSVAVTGVQPKLSVDIQPLPEEPGKQRLTVVGLWGGYILKPPTPQYEALPENEDLTMHLAQSLKIPIAQHSLIRLPSGELAYLTKRFDRQGELKLAQEDMCQIAEKLTEDKYRGSMELVGKLIHRYSHQPGLDAVTFFELALFCYLTGNADMHLKNFSLLTSPDSETFLSPAYDLLATKLAMPSDMEEMGLGLNGKRNRLKKVDFDTLADKLKISAKTRATTYARFLKAIPNLKDWIEISFLPPNLKEAYVNLIDIRARLLA